VLVQKDVIALNCGFDRGPVKAYKRKRSLMLVQKVNEVVGVDAKRCHCSQLRV